MTTCTIINKKKACKTVLVKGKVRLRTTTVKEKAAVMKKATAKASTKATSH